MSPVSIGGTECYLFASEEEIRANPRPIIEARSRLGIETPDTEPLRYLARIGTNPGYLQPRLAVCLQSGSEFLLAGYIRQNGGLARTKTLKFILNGLKWANEQGAAAAGVCVARLLSQDHCVDGFAQLFPLADSKSFFESARRNGLMLNVWNKQTQRLATLYHPSRPHPRDQISSKRRLRLRKNERLLEAMAGGPVRIETVTSRSQVDAFLEATNAIYPNTWQSEKGLGLRDTAAWRATLTIEAEAERLYSHILYANEVPIAYQFGTIYGNTFNYEVMGFDQNYAKASPGQMLRIEMLSQLFDRRIVGFEMGAGDYEFKQSWSDHSADIGNFQLCRKTPLGCSKFLARGLRTGLAQAYRRLRPTKEDSSEVKTNT